MTAKNTSAVADMVHSCSVAKLLAGAVFIRSGLGGPPGGEPPDALRANLVVII